MLLVAMNAIAQTFSLNKNLKNNYIPIKPKGNIPEDLCNLFTEAYNKDKQNQNNEKNTRKEKQAKEKFLQESNYYLNQILTSGIVLYNTDLNEYIEKILDKILVNEPEIRKNIRLYILKTPTVNASATDKGILFVNLGLIAQCSSESQLAFILSHELIHYIKKHNINLFLEKEKLASSNTVIRSGASKDWLYKTHFRSREMETESDEKGFEDLFLKTNYDLNQAIETFDVLQYAYLPFDEVVFDKSFLTDSMFFFPDKYFPDAINTIKARDDYDDENSTHPNIKKRREALQERIEKLDNKTRIINPMGNDNFKSVRDIARFECLRLFIIEQNFTQSFYNAWLMKNEYPQNQYIDQIISASLYGLSKYKKQGSIGDVVPNVKKTEGEIHAVNSLFKNIKENELTAIALRYTYKSLQKYPEDKYLTAIKDDLFKDLVVKNKAEIKTFEKNAQNYSSADISDDKSDSLQKQSSKIRNIEKKKKNQKSIEFYNYIFAGLMNNEAFLTDFKNAIKNNEKSNAKKKENEDNEDDADTDEELANNEDEEELISTRYYQRRGFKLGIDSILLYNPFYIKFDFRKQQELRFFDTEKSQLAYIALLKENAQKLNLNMDIVSANDLKSSGTELYLKHQLLNDWTDEFNNWDINGKKVLFLSEDIKSIIKDYNTKYLNLTGIISAKAKQLDNRMFSYMLYSALSPVTWPLTFPYFFRPAYKTMYYNMVVDMETGKKIYVNASAIDMSDSKALLNSKIYDTFNQIKTKE